MALPFNPFEKGNSKTGSPKKFTKVKVFERADFEIRETQPEPAKASDAIIINDASNVLTTSHVNGIFTGEAGEISFAPKISPDVQQKIDRKTQEADDAIASKLKVRDEVSEEKGSTALVSRELGVSSPLVSEETTPVTALVSRELGVSSPLDSLSSKDLGVSSPLGQTLGRRELGVRQNQISALDPETLVGDERALVLYVADQCRQVGSLETNWQNSEDLKNLLKLDSNELRNLIFRIKTKGYFTVESRQAGRVGLRRFKLTQTMYQTASALVRREAGVSSPLGQALGQALVLPPSSSRGVFLNNSTTTQSVDNSDPDAGALENLDFSIVAEFGITSSTINRCRELYPSVSNDQLAALTERFGQFMKTPDGKRVQNARGFFISLAEQLSKGVTPLDHIETNSEALMREFVERAKEAKVRRDLLEKEAFEFAFEEWVESLDSKSKDQLVPATSVIESGSKIQTMKLKEHFRLSVWPTRFAVSKEPPGAET